MLEREIQNTVHASAATINELLKARDPFKTLKRSRLLRKVQEMQTQRAVEAVFDQQNIILARTGQPIDVSTEKINAKYDTNPSNEDSTLLSEALTRENMSVNAPYKSDEQEQAPTVVDNGFYALCVFCYRVDR